VPAAPHLSLHRANTAHIRQSRPDCGPDFQMKVLKPFHAVPSSIGEMRVLSVSSNRKDSCSRDQD